MKGVYSCFFFVLGFVCSSSLYAQHIDECRSDINNFYKKNAKVNVSKSYYLKYGVQTFYKDKTISNKEIVFTLKYKNDQVHVYSELLETHADKHMVISLSPLSKKIVIGNSSEKQFDLMVNSATQINDSLLWDNFVVASCKPVLGKKEFNHEVILKPKKSNATITELLYWYTKGSSSLYKVVTNYNAISPIEKLIYTFYKVDYNYSGSEENLNSIYNLFFDSKGKLLPAYKSFEVIDQRNK